MAQSGDVITLMVAGSAGVLSFASPCVLPLVPGYLSFVSGVSIDDAHDARRRVLVSAAFVCLGFSLVFIAMGATASAFGQLLLHYRVWIARVGGAMLAVLGLHMIGLFDWQIFGRDTRVHIQHKPIGNLGSTVVGMAFAAGWSPCLGPILGGILTYAATMETIARGITLLTAYSLGLAIPFLLAAWATEPLLRMLKKRRALIQWGTRIGGAILVVVGLLLVTGSFAKIASVLQAWTPAALRLRL